MKKNIKQVVDDINIDKADLDDTTDSRLNKEIIELRYAVDNLTKIVASSSKHDDTQILIILKGLKDSISQNNSIVTKSLEQSNEIINMVRQEVKEIKENNEVIREKNEEKFNNINSELKSLYEAVLNINVSEKETLQRVIDRVEDVEELEENHFPKLEDDIKIVKELVDEKKKKKKDKQDAIKIFKSEWLKKVANAIPIIVVVLIIINIPTAGKIVEWIKNILNIP